MRKSQSFVCCLYAFSIITFLWKVLFKDIDQIQCFTGDANFKFCVLLPYPVVWMGLNIFSAFQTVARHWADALTVLSKSVLDFGEPHGTCAKPVWFIMTCTTMKVINCINSNLPMSLPAFVYLNSAEMRRSLSILNNRLANFAVSSSSSRSLKSMF